MPLRLSGRHRRGSRELRGGSGCARDVERWVLLDGYASYTSSTRSRTRWAGRGRPSGALGKLTRSRSASTFNFKQTGAGKGLTPFPRRGFASGPSVAVGARKRPPGAPPGVPGCAPWLPVFVCSHSTTFTLEVLAVSRKTIACGTVTFVTAHGVHGALWAGGPHRDDGRSRCRAGFRVRSYVSRPGRKAFQRT